MTKDNLRLNYQDVRNLGRPFDNLTAATTQVAAVLHINIRTVIVQSAHTILDMCDMCA